MKKEIKLAVEELKRELKDSKCINYETFVKHIDSVPDENLCLSAHGALMEWDSDLEQWTYVI